jgi:hypothetical protein
MFYSKKLLEIIDFEYEKTHVNKDKAEQVGTYSLDQVVFASKEGVF